MIRRTPEVELRDLARLLLRAGVTTPEETHRELTEAIGRTLPKCNADATAMEWLAVARAALLAEQANWPVSTDHDALLAAFGSCERLRVKVLQGVPDHWAAKEELDRQGVGSAGPRLRGVLWFTPTDVWHAIDEGMLEVNLWHATTANAAPGDDLLVDVLDVFEEHGLAAHFDEGRIEVAARWRKRL